MTTPPRTALVAGGTGLVGGELVRRLAATPYYHRVVLLTRRPIDTDPSGTLHPVVVDFDRLEASRGHLAADDVYCALGTTLRKAGSQTAFRRVDHDYVVELARLARAQEARHFLLVSSVGANRTSRVFYSRVKGEVEASLQELGYPSLTIVRPSLLLGARAEFRLGEAIAKPLGVLMPRRYRPVHASAVAATMIRAAMHARVGARIIESGEIKD